MKIVLRLGELYIGLYIHAYVAVLLEVVVVL